MISVACECCEEAHRCLEGCSIRMERLLDLCWRYVSEYGFPYGEASPAYHNCLCNVGN